MRNLFALGGFRLRAGLAGLALALLAGGWMALAPAPASADGLSGNHGNAQNPVIRVGTTVFCNSGDIPGTIPVAGQWKKGANANSFEAHVYRGSCPSTWQTGNGVFTAGSESGSWKLQLNSTSGRSGTKLASATFGTLPASFPQRNTGSTAANPRSGDNSDVRTGTDGQWSRSGNWSTPATITFTVPNSHTGDVYLLFEGDGEDSGCSCPTHWHLNLRFTPPGQTAIAAFPLLVPQDSGGALPASGSASATQERPTGGTSQRARLFVRAADPSATYTASDANAARSAFDSATIKITSDSAGETAIANATITGSDGSSALAACDEATAGNTCTIQSANFPQASGMNPLTTHQDIYFQVPAAHSGDFYVHVTMAKSGNTSRSSAQRYQPRIKVWPLYVPAGTASGTDLSAGTRRYLPAGGWQRAALYLRAADPSGTFTSSDANIAINSFSTVDFLVSSDAAGVNNITGARISAPGTGSLGSVCQSGVTSPCSGARLDWPTSAGLASPIEFRFSVPSSHTGPAYLFARVNHGAQLSRSFVLRYDVPLLDAHPLVMPAGTASGTNVSAGARNFAANGASQQVTVNLRAAAHSGTYTSTEANAAPAAIGDATIKITSDAAGTTALSGAKISSDAAGNTVVSACTETSVGDTCTITSANWPATGGVMDALNFYFSVPSSHTGNAYVVVTATRSGRGPRSFSLQYGNTPVDAHPLVMPAGTSSGTDVSAGTRDLATGGASQEVTANLRAAAHSGTFTSGDANAAASAISGATITIASDEAGASPISGAKISSDAAGSTAVTGCTGTPNTCTITSANWPATGGTTDALSFHFSVPSDHVGDAYVVLTAAQSGRVSQSFALQYGNTSVGVAPLAAPVERTGVPAGTWTNVDVTARAQTWLHSYSGDSGRERVAVYLRDAAHGNRYLAAGTNVAPSAFDSVRIRLASDAAGTTPLTGPAVQLQAEDRSGDWNTDGPFPLSAVSACTEAVAGPTCTVTSANWPVSGGVTQPLQLVFTVPDYWVNRASFHTGDIYLVVTVSEAGKTDRTFSLKYGDPYISAYPLAVPQDAAGNLIGANLSTAARDFAAGGASQRARLFVRDEPHGESFTAGAANAERDEFSWITIQVEYGTITGGGTLYTPLTGAKLTKADGTTALDNCGEGTTAGNKCTIGASDWPQASGTDPPTLPLDVWFSVPDTRSEPVYLGVHAVLTGKTAHEFHLKYEPFLQVWPLAVPAPGGTRETGDVKSASRDFAASDGANQVELYLRSAGHSNTYTAAETNVGRADFDRVKLWVATAEDGATRVSGAKITGSDGSSALTACTETTAGELCTITSANWPQATSGTPLRTLVQNVYFTVPDDHDDPVWLVVSVEKDDRDADRVFSVEYDPPYAGYPLVAPSGSTDGVDLGSGAGNFAAGGSTQQVSIYLRAGWHGDVYRSSADANIGRSDFTSAKITIASDEDGSTAITGAKISSDAAGSTAVTGCTGTPNTCTITSANWPQASSGTPLLTVARDIYFSVPNTVSSTVFVVVELTASGKSARTFALRYDPGLPVFPLIVPAGTSSGDNLGTATRKFALAGAAQQGSVRLRSAWHSNIYDTSDTDTAKSEFDSAVIRIATDNQGANPATGAVLSSNSAGTAAISACTESSPGHTCTITRANWPGATTAGALDFWFSVPENLPSDTYVVVTVRKAGEPDRVQALSYLTPLTPAFPLAIPQNSSGTLETGNVKTRSDRLWDREAGQQRARIYLRGAVHADAYDSSHANAPRARFGQAEIKIATTSAGTTEVTGAKLTSDGGSTALSGCAEGTTAGPTCTIPAASWAIDGNDLTQHLDIYWSVPDDTTTDAYLVVSISATNKDTRVFHLKYGKNLPVFPLLVHHSANSGDDVTSDSLTYATGVSGHRVRVFLREEAHENEYNASGDANAARNLFDSVQIRIATDATGGTEVPGARISHDTIGVERKTNCTETAIGPTCTVTRANWPAGSGGTAGELQFNFKVPIEYGEDAYVVAIVRRAGQDDRVFSLEYGDPYIKLHPLAVPIVGGNPESGDLSTAQRSFEPEAGRQQVRIYLRDSWHGNEYDASDTNVADSAFNLITIRIATDASGVTDVTGAAIYGASSGNTALSTGCTAGAANCSINGANWPDAADGTNAPLDLWFSVPDNTANPVYVTITPAHASLQQRVYALRYKPGLPVFPVAVPRTTSDGYETGNLGERTGAFAGNNARQKATVFLRDESPGNMYDATDTNVDQSDSSLFDSVTLTIATAADGGTAISGARFYGGASGSGGLRGCSGNTCTITRANWPSSGGLDLWFSVPDSRTQDAFLHVAVNKAGEPSREAATRYESSYVRAYQLIVPKTGASTYTSLAQARRWQPEGGDQRAGIFLREQPRSSYDAAHANAPAANVDSAVIKITSDAGGASPLTGAEITSDGSAVLSACTESAAGHTCTIPVADWPQSGSPALATELDFQFSAPDSHRGDVYVHVTLIKSGKTNRTGSLRWQAPLSVSAFPRPRALNATGGVISAGEFDAMAGTDRARVELRSSAGGSGGASTSAFQRVIITVAADADGGSPISGAKLSSDAAGSTVIGACTETSVGNTCTVPVADWPVSGAVAGNLDLYFSVPLAHGAAAYLVARAENAGERDRVAALKYDAPIGSLSGSAGPVLDARLSGGEREQDDDGDGSRLDNLRWYDTAASSRQRLAVRIYKTARSTWSGSAELASFESLDSTAALTLSASYPTGQTTTGLGAAHIEFTKPDGTALGCSEASYAGGNCTLTRATLKTLMGVGGAADARRTFELEFAFSIKTAFTNSGDVTVQASVGRYIAGASSESTIVYARGITAAAANAQPFAMQLRSDGTPEQGNVLTRDPQRRYAPGGQDTPVNLRIYASSSALDTYSSSVNLVPYASVEEVKLEIKDRPSPNALIANAAITVQKNDGTSACTEAAGNVCTITGANFLASGPPRAAGYYRALPLDFTFTVPAGYVNADFGNADLVISVRRGGSGTPASRTQTFTLPFDGGTRAQPFAMASNAAYSAAAGNQQWAAGGRRTPVWLHVYNTEKSSFEAVATNNTAQYWEFDQTAGAEVITIELLDGQTGEAAPRRARITAPDSDEKFAPCAESRPGPVCTISLAALKAYDSGATTDDDYVDPLRFAVSVPQGSTASIRIRAGVQRSDDVPGSNPAVKERKVREFALYAPWPYPQLVPLDDDGEPPAGSIGLVPWEYEPRGQRTPLLLGLYNERRAGAYAAPSAANQPALSDFETVTLTVLDRDGAPLADARITARSGAPLSACRPAGNECEISRAEWRALQPGGGALVRAPLEFAVIVPAAYGEAISVRAVIEHSGRNAPDAALPSGQFTVGSVTVGIADDSGARSTHYRLSMVSPVKKAFALPLLDDGEGGLRVCAKDEPGAACTAPSAQQGAALGFAAAITRGLDSHPAKPDPDRDELVQYDEVESLRITATGGTIIHRALCPAAEPEHPVDPAQPAAAPNDCTVPGALLQAFHGAEPSDPIRPLELVVVPDAASGTVSLAYDIAGSDDVIEATMAFTAAAGEPRLAAAVFFDWTDPGADYDAARPAVLFTVGRRDSRAGAPPVPASALPGRLVPATFAELDEEAALQLSISQGTLSYNGVACPDPDACTLPLSRAELLAGSSAASDSWPINSLRAEYALPFERSGPTTLTAAARPADGSPVTGSLAIPHPAVSAPVGAAHLPADADGEISAGATEQLAAGFLIAVADSGAGWACLRPDPSFLELDASGAAVDACALSRAPAPADPMDPQPAPSALHAWLDDDSYLALGGDAVFSGDGGKKLEIGGSSRWNQLRCAPAEGLPGGAGADAGPRDLACWVTDAEGARPEITAAASTSGAPITVSANLIPADGRKFHFILGSGEQPAEQPAARAAAAAAFALPGSVFGSAAIPVGAAAIPASASLLRAGDATGPIPDGAAAALLLRIADAGGRPADPERISSITLTASKGELGGDYCDGGRACTFQARAGSALATAAAEDPGLTARIPLTLTPPDGEGSLTLRAVVVSTAGAQFSAALPLDYAGGAALIRIGEDLPVLHHHATTDAADNAASGAANGGAAAAGAAGSGSGSGANGGAANGNGAAGAGDPAAERGIAEIPITATDAGGRVVELPPRASARVEGPDGATEDRFAIARDCSDGPTACKFRISVTASAADPLPSGRYELVVTGAGLTDAQGNADIRAEFGVAGPAAAIEARAPALPAIGAPLAIRADLTDAQGNAVADGTQVRLSVRSPDGSPSPLIPLDPPPTDPADPASALLRTRNGIAAASMAAASSSVAILSLDAQDGPRTAASLTLVLTPDSGDGTAGSGSAAGDGSGAAGAAGSAPAIQIGFSTWSGRMGASAAAALAASPATQAIYLWNGKRWLRYAATPSGTPVPGSQNFTLAPNDVIYSP